MQPRLLSSALCGLALGAGLGSCGGQGKAFSPQAGHTASPRPSAAGDSFGGRVVRATGRVAGQANTVAVTLRTGPGAGTRPVTVEITGSSCRGRRDCLPLVGALTGTLRVRGGRPDVGRSFAIDAAGRLAPLGTVSARGTGAGTGNIRLGYETLTITVTGHAGTVLIALRSARVPGFTSP